MSRKLRFISIVAGVFLPTVYLLSTFDGNLNPPIDVQGRQVSEPSTSPKSPSIDPANPPIPDPEPTEPVEDGPDPDLQDWLSSPAGSETDRTDLERGRQLLLARRIQIKQLIQTDPEAAIEHALTWTERQRIPVELHPLLEQPINDVGVYGVTVESDFETSRSNVHREVQVNGQRYNAFVYGRMLTRTSSERAPINGIAIDDVMALSESPIRLLETEEAAYRKRIDAGKDPVCTVSGESAGVIDEEIAYEFEGDIHYACRASHLYTVEQWVAGDTGGITGAGELPVALDSWSQGPKTLLFMRVNFPDNLEEPISESAAVELMERVNDWMVLNSYDTTSLNPTITPLLTLPHTKAYYSEMGDGQLLADSREVARAAGYDTDDYDLDVVRFGSVPGYSYGGKAFVRGKGCWLQSSSLGVVCHELGHNYGLWHANYWQAIDNSIIGPGSHKEYGDIFDTMGSAGAGDKHFSAVHRNKIDWMGDSFVHSVSGSGSYRIHAYDIPMLNPDRHYAIKIQRDDDRDYWIEFRHLFASYPHVQNGVLLRWDPWARSSGGAHLLDTTPGSPADNSSKRDAPLVVGRTFSDTAAGIHITPVAIQGSGDQRFVDVVVNRGTFPENQPPTVSIQASALHTDMDEPLVFTAVAQDLEDDTLAYHWTFGDLTFGSNSPVVTHSWNHPGDYVVRCRVSDMKGGYASAFVVVEVGTDDSHTVAGRVTDTEGNPVEGVHVSNGTTSTGSYRGSYTDSDGNYVITRLSGNYSLTANLYGHEFEPMGGWENPLSVSHEYTGIDFQGTMKPVVGLALVDPVAGENGNDPGTFRIFRSGPTDSALTVKYRRSGSASSSSDYTLSPSPSGSAPYSITIPAGESHVDILTTPNQDSSTEGNETVILTLDEHSAYVIGHAIEATLQILDDEAESLPTISVTSSGMSADNLATESGSDQGVFSINRYGNKNNALVVQFNFEGTATPGVDYLPPENTVTIPAGETKVNVAFHVLNDTEVEGDETVVLRLASDPNYTIGSASATITLQDDDPTLVKVTAADSVAVEGGASEAGFLFQRFGDLTRDLRVFFTLSGTATAGTDYVPPPGEVVIPSGATSTSLTLTSLNDTELEGDESVAVTITSDLHYNIAHPGSAVVTIQDNELPTITLSAPDNRATEAGADKGVFRFERAPVLSGDLVIHFEVSGSATAGTDYPILPDSVVIPDGSGQVELEVVALADSIRENDEMVTLRLIDTQAYNIGTSGPVSVAIDDDESTAEIGIGFSAPAASRVESSTTVKVPVVLSDTSSGDVKVAYSVIAGSALNGSDFNLADGTLTVPAGETMGTIDFRLVNDSARETDETITIQLSSPTGALLSGASTHTLTIIDDDAGVVSVSAIDSDASEGGDTGLFRVSRTGGTSGELRIHLQITGSASSPSDYQTLPTFVVIPDGAAGVDLLVEPERDATRELAETVTVRVTSVEGGRVGSPSSATVTIQDQQEEEIAPEFSIEPVDGTTTEGLDDPARIRIVRSQNLSGPVTVTLELGGDATPGSDYVSFQTTLPFEDSQTETFIDLQAIADGLEEPLETLVVSIAESPDYTTLSSGPAVIQFLDSPFMGWQLATFSAPQLAEPGMSDPGSDPDGDGVPNFVEYAFNRDPLGPDDEPLVEKEMMTLEGSGERVLKITYHRRIIRPGVRYELSVSSDLLAWDDNPVHFEEISVTPDDNGVTECVEVKALFPTFHFDMTFVELRVVKE